MKQFLGRLFLFSACFLCFDRLFIFLRNYVPSLEADKRLEKVITGDIHADVLIFGSSRGARNIIAQQIARQTGKSCYNLSYPGSDITFHEFLLRQVLKNNNSKPGIVFLVVDDPSELLFNPTIIFRSDRLYPLVKYNVIREALVERGEKSKILSRIFILSQLSKSNFDIRKKRFNENDTILSCGSMPISFQKRNYQFEFGKNDQYPLINESELKVKAFLGFTRLCESNHIQLVICFPPNFQYPNTGFESRIMNLSVNPLLFNFHYDTAQPAYWDKQYFFDGNHLITKGAVIFTDEVSNFLLKNKFVTNPQPIAISKK